MLKPLLLVLAAMIPLSANSILARAALTETGIDPVSFTTLRIVSGALMLMVLVRLRRDPAAGRGSWISAGALYGYAILFALAYLSLTAATGALLLFGAVQTTMVGWSLSRGEPLRPRQWAGFVLAVAGLVWLLLPGLAAPPPAAAAMMLAAGVCWGVYSLRARGSGDPARATAENFLRASLPAVLLSVVLIGQTQLDLEGIWLALASGMLASGGGYVIWYAALAVISAHTAAVAQLGVPVLVAIAGVLLLAEPLTPRLIAAGLVILLGIALVSLPARRGR
ncbi:MAG: DMT family transporter [Wenzhouxiangellaceae bacterium]|nr:DMT family transporter [Wenzhouxiangellaceae bacterium]